MCCIMCQEDFNVLYNLSKTSMCLGDFNVFRRSGAFLSCHICAVIVSISGTCMFNLVMHNLSASYIH